MKKCSLRGLESRLDFHFFSYPTAKLPPLDQYVILAMDAPLLSEADQNKGIFILDSTWRYADTMMHFVEKEKAVLKRSLPNHFRTAYPRRQEDCLDPERGLASIEAVYIAYILLNRDPLGLFDHYYWKEEFLKNNFS